jgi:hypothetical protein
VLEDGLLDLPQATHLLPHPDLGVTVRLEDRLGHIPQEMVVAVAMRHARELRRDPGHEGVLPVRDPEHHGLAQRLGPLLGPGNQPLHLGGRRGDQGFGEPDAFPGQFPDDVKGLVRMALGLT